MRETPQNLPEVPAKEPDSDARSDAMPQGGWGSEQVIFPIQPFIKLI